MGLFVHVYEGEAGREKGRSREDRLMKVAEGSNEDLRKHFLNAIKSTIEEVLCAGEDIL